MQSSDEVKAALLAAASGPCAPSESKLPAVFDMSCVDGPDVFSAVELVSRATYISRKRRNWMTR